MTTSLAAVSAGCRMKRDLPSSAKEVRAAVVSAAKKGDAEAVYELLDRRSRWSIISVLEAERKARALVLAHYPRHRQAPELRRTARAARAEDGEAYFVSWAKQQRLLARIARFAAVDRREREHGKLILHSGEASLMLCREGELWRYCSLRGELERMKVRAARDLTTVRESAEAFKRSR